MALNKKNESSDQLEEEDLTDELVEWARARRAAASETMPGEAKTAAQIKSKLQPKILVVALEESAAERIQAYLFDDTQAASQFIETLVEMGLNGNRIIVFQGTPVHTTYRLVVTIGEAQQQRTVSSLQPQPGTVPPPGLASRIGFSNPRYAGRPVASVSTG